MMHALTKTLIVGLSSVMVVGGGALAFAQAAPPASAAASHTGTQSPKGAKKAHRHQARGLAAIVTALTRQTVTVTHGKNGQPHTVALTAATVRAGAYPVSASALAVGQRIHMIGLKGTHPVLLLDSVAHGVLQSTSSGAWTVVSKKTTWTLTNPTAALVLGMPSLAAGTRVNVYGTRSTTTVTATVIAAHPQRVRAKITANTQGVITLTTKKDGSLSYPIPTAMPAKWLKAAKAGRQVIALINPATQAVLQLLPAKIAPWHKTVQTAEHNLVGRLTQDSATAMNLQTAWGTEMITPGTRTIHVVDPGHAGASLSQIPVGTNLWIHITAKNLQVRVLPSAHAAG